MVEFLLQGLSSSLLMIISVAKGLVYFTPFLCGYFAFMAKSALNVDDKKAKLPICLTGIFFLLSYGLAFLTIFFGGSKFTLLYCVVGSIVGVCLAFFYMRTVSVWLHEWIEKRTKRVRDGEHQSTDIDSVKELLPKAKNFDPEPYINGSEIFIGMDKEEKPFYLPYEAFRREHTQIMGATGQGKGVVAQLLLTQFLMRDEAVIVIEPKNDEYAASALKQACDKLGKKFVLIDLRDDSYQVDIFAGADAYQKEELMLSAFSLSDSGSDADHYRQKDRDAAKYVASLKDCHTFKDMFSSDYVQSIPGMKKGPEGFYYKLREISGIKALNANGGYDIRDVIDNGGCLYVIGSITHSGVIMAQKTVFMRILQLISNRDRTNGSPRIVRIFLDELKYHLSKTSVAALGTVRDKNGRLILAHQSLDDMKDVPKDLNVDAVIGAVTTNCAIHISYFTPDFKSRKYVSESSGTVEITEERRGTEVNGAFAEKRSLNRMLIKSSRPLIDENMQLSLTYGMGIVFGQGFKSTILNIRPLNVEKKVIDIYAVKDNKANQIYQIYEPDINDVSNLPEI